MAVAMLQELAASIDPLVPARSFMSDLAPSLGLPVDQFLYISAILFGLPAGLGIRLIPTSLPRVRHLYVLVVGFALSWYCFKETTLIGVALMLISYTILAITGGRKPFVFFFGVIVLALLAHIIKMQINYGNFLIDFQSPFLLIVVKISYIGWNMYDGLPDLAQPRSPTQARMAIVGLPSLLEYFAYMFFFGTFFAGPVAEFQEYRQWIRGEAEFATVPPLSQNFIECGRALVKAVAAVTAILVVVNPYFNVHSRVLCCGATSGSQPCIDAVAGGASCSPHQLSGWFTDLSVPMRALFLIIAPALYRTSFYFVWYLDEAICNLCGIGYQGAGKPWNRCRHGDWWGVEVSQSIQSSMSSWNAGANTWLRRCVYERMQGDLKFGMQASQLITFLVSGLWHGIYIGHLMTFIGGFVLTTLGQQARRSFRPLFQNAEVGAQLQALKAKSSGQMSSQESKEVRAEMRKLDTEASMPLWYNALCVVFTGTLLNLIAVPFILLDYGDTVAVLTSISFLSYILVAVAFIVCGIVEQFVTGPQLRKMKKAA